MNFVVVSVNASSSYELRLSFARTFKSNSGGRSGSGVVLNFGEGGSIFLGGLVPALRMSEDNVREGVLRSVVVIGLGCESVEVMALKRRATNNIQERVVGFVGFPHAMIVIVVDVSVVVAFYIKRWKSEKVLRCDCWKFYN